MRELFTGCDGLFRGAMRGRTMYVVPFCMGPLGSPLVRARRRDHRLRLRRRLHADHDPDGQAVLDELGDDGFFVKAVHTARRPARRRARPTSPWPCNEHQVHLALPRDPRDLVVRLRLRRQRAARQEVLRAAHRLRHGARRGLARRAHADPQAHPAARARPKYIAAAFPSACGKTNLAMLEPTIPGWKVETVGDDIAWMRFGEDGRLYAINPEAGFFGVAPGTGEHTNANAMKTMYGNSVFTNVALTDDGDVWWEGMTEEPPGAPHRLEGQRLDPRSPARPPRTPTPASPSPPRSARSIAPEWEDPKGVPISAILFGGRRASAVPLVTESFDWQHGVFLGANVASREDRRRRGQGRRAAPRPVRDAAVLRLQHGRLLRATGSRSAQAHDAGEAAEDLLRQLVPQGRRRQVRVARLRREQPGPQVDRRAARRRGRGRRDARSACCRPTGALDTEGLELADGRPRPAADGRHRGLARGGRADPRSTSRPSATTRPKELWDEYRSLVRRLG